MDETAAVLKSGDKGSTDVKLIVFGLVFSVLVKCIKDIKLSENAIKIARINNGLVTE